MARDNADTPAQERTQDELMKIVRAYVRKSKLSQQEISEHLLEMSPRYLDSFFSHNRYVGLSTIKTLSKAIDFPEELIHRLQVHRHERLLARRHKNSSTPVQPGDECLDGWERTVHNFKELGVPVIHQVWRKR